MVRFSVYACVISFTVFAKVECLTKKEQCETSCIKVESCRFFQNLKEQDQASWMDRFYCDQSTGSSSAYRRTPSEKNDIVCCPENVWNVESSQSASETNDGEKPDTSQKSPEIEKNSYYYYPNNQYGDNDNRYSSDDETTTYENTRIWQNRRRQRPVAEAPNPYFMPARPNPNDSQSSERSNIMDNMKQCPITNIPPKPTSGCCGREANEEERMVASQYPNNMPQASWEQPSYSRYSGSSESNSRQKRAADLTIDTRIAGGQETELEQFPWTVLLKTTFAYPDKDVAFSCGGSLISSTYILTAGHCVFDQKGSIKEIEVYLAEYDKRTFPKDCKNVLGRGQVCVENIVMQAESVHLHPQYDDNYLNNDIALIKLQGNAPYTDYIRPICLPPINVDSPDLIHLRLAVAGWGRNGQYKSDIKQSTIVNLVPFEQCARSYPGLTKQQLCAAGYTGEDTCKGDSGGPLMMMYKGTYYLSGVVSGKRADAPCGTSVPSLYTNVFTYLPWIKSIIGF